MKILRRSDTEPGGGRFFLEMGRGLGAGMRRYAREGVGATLTCGEATQWLRAALADRRDARFTARYFNA
jgi:hypothetical protein